ncbi:TetR/AcrR family transcriptional regulator [Ornithinimicrobium panacihumi]|uniref:TetR/AcrR family transcriptional regulator n=1 Tax=Ornithinimicrobium panacihumi TaxID=2008449 RepID=UPI003F88D6C6
MSDSRPRRTHVPVEQRRAQITQAALAVMKREGAWALTTRAVATEAGVPLGAVHYAHGSKDALIASVLDSDVELGARLIRSAGASEDLDARDALEASITAYLDAVREHPLRELVLQELSLMGVREGSLTPLVRDSMAGYRRTLTEALAEVAERRDLRWSCGAHVTAELVFGQLVGLAQNWLAAPDDALLEACVSAMADLYATTLVPAGDATPPA